MITQDDLTQEECNIILKIGIGLNTVIYLAKIFAILMI